METLRYVLLANGLLAVVSLTFYVLLRRETFFETNRLALWLGLTAALLLPLVELPDWRPQPVRTVMQRTAQVIVPRVLPNSPPPNPDVTITFPNGRTYPAFPAQQRGFNWTWQLGLAGLYAGVVLVLLFRLGLQMASLRRLIRRSKQERYDDFTLVMNEQVTSPFSFFGWAVLNPDQHTPDELDQILRHERVHIRARHSVDMIGAELVCIVFWFNPAAYLFRRLLHQTLEFSADRAVLAEGVDLKAYQYNLLKVSLSAGQSAITNHFSRSQLKSRIVMLNQPKSAKITWLKYPVLWIAALTVAATFARPSVKTLSKYVPKSVAQTIVAVTELSKERPKKLTETKSVAETQPIEPAIDNELKPALSPQQTGFLVDTISRPIKKDSVRTSPSRYMRYEGDKLYWIITPRTSFDDLAIMKQEFERHGYKMQVRALKYDPLNAYISDIKITIIRPTAGVSDFEETGVDGGPVRSHGGYNGLNTLKTVAAVGSYPFNTDFLDIPDELVQIARNEELYLTKFIHDNKIKYLIATGRKISNKYAPSSSAFNVSGLLAQPNIIRKYGIKLNADSTLDISDTSLPVFINNEPVSNIAAKHIIIKRFATLISSEEYGKNGQQGAVRALLFYTNDFQ